MNADIKQMIAEKTEFLLADDGNNIDQEERLRAIEELRGLEMVQADSVPADGAEKSGAMQMMLREINHTYTTMLLRAAYRAGMSTAAAICDENHARLIGDKIMAARELIDVPRDVLSAAGKDARLISAAPDMYEALQLVVSHLEDVLTGPIMSHSVTIDTNNTPTLIRARAALAKADGTLTAPHEPKSEDSA